MLVLEPSNRILPKAVGAIVALTLVSLLSPLPARAQPQPPPAVQLVLDLYGPPCTNAFPGGDILCASDQKCRQGTCVPECDVDADCPNSPALTTCNGGACEFVRGGGVGTSLCNGEAFTDWTAHAVDPGLVCDDSAANPFFRGTGGDNGADGVDVCDIDGDGDLDVVTGWEEGSEVFLYLNPLRGELSDQVSVPELLQIPWPVVDARGRGTNDGENQRKKATGIEDAVFADLHNPASTTGRGLCSTLVRPHTVITAQEGIGRKVVMRTPPDVFSGSPLSLDSDALRIESGWEAREFGDTEKFFMQAAVGDIDGLNCNDVVVGAKNNQRDYEGDPGPEDIPNTIDGGVWWFRCPALELFGEATDIPADQFYADVPLPTLQSLLRQDSGGLRAGGNWVRNKIGDGRFLMNVVLDDIDGDGDNDVVFSDRKRIGWFANPRFDPVNPRNPTEGPWDRIVIEDDEDIRNWCVSNTVIVGDGNSSMAGPACFGDEVPGEVFRDMAYADLDGDGLEDIVAATNYRIEEDYVVARWYRRLGGGGGPADWQVYEISASDLPFGREYGVNQPPVSKSVSVADIDLDGDNDLVLTVRGGGHGVYALSFPEDPTNECGGACINSDASQRGAWTMTPIAPAYPVMKYDNVVLADLDEDCDIDAVTADEFVVAKGVGLGVPWYENPLVSGRPLASCQPSVTLQVENGTCAASVTPSRISNSLFTRIDPDEPARGRLRVGLVGGGLRNQISLATGTDIPVRLAAEHRCTVERTGENPSSECQSLVTVLDRQAPTLSCPAPQTLECHDGVATVDFALPTVSDNCDPNLTASCTPASGSEAEVGASGTVSCEATDSSGLTGDCSFGYEVVDTLAPVFGSAPAEVSRACTGPMTPVSLTAPSADDQCQGPIVAEAVDGFPPDSQFEVGLTTITWESTDLQKLSAQVTQTVRIIDALPPSITAPADVLGVECTDPAGTPVQLGRPTDVLDTCDPEPTVSNDARPLFPLGPTPVTWVAEDGSGNQGTDLQNVQVRDTTAPVLVPPADRIAECSAPGGTPTPDLGKPAVTEVCDPAPLVENDARALLPLGPTPVEWTAIDESRNRSSPVLQTVRILDTTAPVITAPEDVIAECAGPEGTAVPTLGAPTVVEICDGSPQIANNALALYPLGDYPVFWTATDASDNKGEDSQLVSILDRIAPEIVCGDSQVLEPTSPAGAPAFFETSATDICSSSLEIGCDAESGDLFPIGATTPVTCQASDPSENVATCGFTVRVLSCDELALSLQGRAGDLGLNGGRTQSVISRLTAVRRSLENGRTGPACSQIHSIGRSLEAWIAAGQLTSGAAEAFLDSLARLSACTGCAG